MSLAKQSFDQASHEIVAVYQFLAGRGHCSDDRGAGFELVPGYRQEHGY